MINGTRASSVSLSPQLEISDAWAAIAAVEAGDGITLALSYMVADKIRAGRLVTRLDAVAPPPIRGSLISPQSRLISPKVKAFVGYAAPRLRRALAAGSAAITMKEGGQSRTQGR